MTRHVRTPAGVETFHEPIGSPITSHSRIAEAAAKKLAEIDSAGDIRRFTDTPKNTPTFKPDIAAVTESTNTQSFAQRRADDWFTRVDNNAWNESESEQRAASVWSEYQMPAQYGKINSILRDGTPIEGITKPMLQSYVSTLWEKASYKIPTPMTVYRAMKGKRSGAPKDIDWATTLKPGSTFQDDGFVSTTTLPWYAQGWLNLDHFGGDNRQPQADDVVMEIRIPAGTRIVGGNVEFIETMLRPGSRFKIISSDRRRSTPENPLGDGMHRDANGLERGVSLPANPYTHVIAELIP